MRCSARFSISLPSALLAFALCCVLGCSPKTDGSGQTSTAQSPGLIGFWKASAPVPHNREIGTSEVWLSFQFGEDGKLRLHYAPALPVSMSMMSSMAFEDYRQKRLFKTVPYSIVDDKHFRLFEYGVALTYTYELSGSHLLVTLPMENNGDGVTNVYDRQN